MSQENVERAKRADATLNDAYEKGDLVPVDTAWAMRRFFHPPSLPRKRLEVFPELDFTAAAIRGITPPRPR